MKTLIALLLFAVPLWAQNTAEDIVKPIISTATIDSIRTTAGSATISTQSLVGGGRFASVTKGCSVWGAGVPFGTTVVDTSSGTDSVIILSKALTTTDSSGSANKGRGIFNFGYYAATTYENGDYVGLPFLLPNAAGKVLTAILVVDSSDVLDSMDVLLFNEPLFDTVPVRDTMAATVTEDALPHILGLAHLNTMTDLGDVRITLETDQGDVFPVSWDKVYGRLISRSTEGMLFTSTTALVLRFKYTY